MVDVPARTGNYGPEVPQSAGFGARPIVWRPDGAGDAKTWADVMALRTAIGAPVQIFCPQESTGTPVYVIEPGPGSSVLYELGQSWLTGPLGPHDAIQIQLRRGATLRALAGLSGGIRLQANKQTGDPPGIVPVPVAPGDASVFAVERGASLTNLASATDAIITTEPGAESYITFAQLGTAESKSGGAAVVFASASSLLHVVALSGGLSLDTMQPPGWIGGDASATVEWLHDGSMAFAPNFWTQNPALASTQRNTPTGQGGGSGPTAFRPVFQGGGPPSTGCVYFDTTIGKPVFWSGSQWVDATGTPA